MAKSSAARSEKPKVSPIEARMAGDSDAALARTLATIESLGLTQHVLDLELKGYTVVPDVLSADRVERAKSAILRRAEGVAEHKIDPEKATAEDFNGMNYLHYLLFDDPVFPEILLEPKPLALMSYLLGESCVLSSMGCHFRGPGGMPLAVHADGSADGLMTPASMVANCNYALTPYTQENGAVVLFPGSHRRVRQPTLHENWMTADGQTVMDVMAKQLEPAELDKIQWQQPTGAVTIECNPGDAVIWHGNSWHGGWRREAPGTRINLACYFCRPHMATQELRGDTGHQEVFERYANEPRFAQLLGSKVFNGWREEGPDFTGARTNPRGLFD